MILRDGDVVAVLPEGDPMRYLLGLPAERLRSMRENLTPVLETRPEVRRVFDAIVDYREESESARRRRNR